jgi:hypothetical protein
MQQHQPVVAEIDLVAEHEAGHAEDASREGLLDRRRELRRGLRLLEGYAEFGLVEPDPLDERGAEVIVQRRGAVDEQRPGREIGAPSRVAAVQASARRRGSDVTSSDSR